VPNTFALSGPNLNMRGTREQPTDRRDAWGDVAGFGIPGDRPSPNAMAEITKIKTGS